VGGSKLFWFLALMLLPKTKCGCLDKKQAPPKVARGEEKFLKPSVYRDVILKDDGLLSGRPKWELSQMSAEICPETSHRIDWRRFISFTIRK